MAIDYDGVWKEALEHFFHLVLALLFPETWQEIHWPSGYESLGTELHKILPEAEVGKRFCDVVVKAYAQGTEEERDPRCLHGEVQCQKVEDFLNRLHDYNSLLKLKLGHPIISLVIFGDDDPEWEPNHYVYECGGYRKDVLYPTAKLLKFRGREEELLRHENPLALLVVAHLLTLSTGREEGERREGKLRLLLAVLERKMEPDENYHILRLIDSLVELPAESQRELWQEIHQRAREDQMPFLSYPEQVAVKKGLLRALEAALGAKFREEGLALLPRLEEQQDLDLLTRILVTIATTDSLDDVRQLLP
jgi:hypothetical protein